MTAWPGSCWQCCLAPSSEPMAGTPHTACRLATRSAQQCTRRRLAPAMRRFTAILAAARLRSSRTTRRWEAKWGKERRGGVANLRLYRLHRHHRYHRLRPQHHHRLRYHVCTRRIWMLIAYGSRITTAPTKSISQAAVQRPVAASVNQNQGARLLCGTTAIAISSPRTRQTTHGRAITPVATPSKSHTVLLERMRACS
jgi:hypothetical protein